jgi:hypothetical protein
MDRTIAYDEPLDPHWERLNALGASLDEVLEGLAPTSANNDIRHHSRENVVPFQTRQVRALEMRANLDRAKEDGHFAKFPELEAARIAFTVFADRAESLGFVSETKGGKAKLRDELLEIFGLAWVRLREHERDGFPLMDYVDSPTLGDPEIVGTLEITKLPDGTIVSTKHKPLSNEPGVS